MAATIPTNKIQTTAVVDVAFQILLSQAKKTPTGSVDSHGLTLWNFQAPVVMTLGETKMYSFQVSWVAYERDPEHVLYWKATSLDRSDSFIVGIFEAALLESRVDHKVGSMLFRNRMASSRLVALKSLA